MTYRPNDVHGSILLTEGTKTGCFCAHTHVHTEQAGKTSMPFTLNEQMPSLLFTSWKCFKTAQKQVYKKKHEYRKYLGCVSLLGAVFSDFCDASTGFPNQ